MKYANKLTDEELREIYSLFIDSDGKINELNITRDENSIGLEGCVEIPEFEEERLAEDANATLIIDDDYQITDYDVKVYHHSGIVHQFIENGCIASLVIDMQGITCSMTKKFRFTYK